MNTLLKIIINKETVVEIENTTPRKADKLTLYSSDGWHPEPSNLLIKNLIFEQGKYKLY